MAQRKQPGEYMDKVIGLKELVDLLAPFGMIVQLDPGAEPNYQAMQMAHALAGCVQAHASRAEDAYRVSAAANGETDKETWEHITQASLMAFAGINCRSVTDELALINWQATRLAGVLGALDFPGPIKREDNVGSGDTLMRTIRLTAAALSGMVKAAHAASDPHRPDGELTTAGQGLVKAMSALAAAAEDVKLHTATGELMAMGD
ncbi:hypothetical protein [Actinomadura violacea]|uniref:Uncharacterized protein n=1 Tax=Actinomadura violacea TaxID=2819934 RepID=A0ABS3RYV5_9ACTN|nr:hypothetical protein [Actinomadura violacea]MBO2461643.1 hypothetical protein [Actinomadura violacea]